MTPAKPPATPKWIPNPQIKEVADQYERARDILETRHTKEASLRLPLINGLFRIDGGDGVVCRYA